MPHHIQQARSSCTRTWECIVCPKMMSSDRRGRSLGATSVTNAHLEPPTHGDPHNYHIGSESFGNLSLCENLSTATNKQVCL
jgi:hypothetical protein